MICGDCNVSRFKITPRPCTDAPNIYNIKKDSILLHASYLFQTLTHHRKGNSESALALLLIPSRVNTQWKWPLGSQIFYYALAKCKESYAMVGIQGKQTTTASCVAVNLSIGQFYTCITVGFLIYLSLFSHFRLYTE